MAVAVVVALVGTFTIAGFAFDPVPAGADTAIAVAPNSELQGGQVIEVSGSGFTPNSVMGFCQGVQTTVPDPDNCGTSIVTVSPGPDGTFATTHRIERFVFVPSLGTWRDCANPATPCVIGAAEQDDISGTAAYAALPFAAPPPPPTTPGEIEAVPELVNPPAGVGLTGTGFRANARIDVYQCLADPDHPMDCNSRSTSVDADASGSFSAVSSLFTADRFVNGTDCLTVPGCTFAAAEAVDFAGTVVSIPVNFPPPPLRVVPGGATVSEGASGTQVVDIPVTLNQSSTDTVTVDWTTLQVSGAPDFQAEPGTDYTPASGVVTFVPGETTRTVPVTVNGDPDVEPDEYFVVSFTNPTNAIMGGFWGLGFGVIENDDVFPRVVPGAGSVTEGDSGSQELSVPVSLSKPWHDTVTVQWATVDTLDQPQAGVDYEPASGTVTFAPGETEGSVPVTVYGDTEPEDFLFGAEWGAVRFHTPTSATLGEGFDRIGWVLIVDDD